MSRTAIALAAAGGVAFVLYSMSRRRLAGDAYEPAPTETPDALDPDSNVAQNPSTGPDVPFQASDYLPDGWAALGGSRRVLDHVVGTGPLPTHGDGINRVMPDPVDPGRSIIVPFAKTSTGYEVRPPSGYSGDPIDVTDRVTERCRSTARLNPHTAALCRHIGATDVGVDGRRYEVRGHQCGYQRGNHFIIPYLPAGHPMRSASPAQRCAWFMENGEPERGNVRINTSPGTSSTARVASVGIVARGMTI